MSKIHWAGQTIDVTSTNPNTSIQKEILRLEDGSCIGQKHSVSIKGYFYAEGDPIQKERQADLYIKMIALFNKQSDNGTGFQQGLLEIQPDSNAVSQDNTITYKDAKLTGISLPEPPDETAGIQFQEYTITFEAFQPKDDIFDAYKIASVSETWNIKKSTEMMLFNSSNVYEDESKYAFDIEHTLSAVGITKFDGDGKLLADEATAWFQAWKYVNARLGAENALNSIDSTTLNKNGFLSESSKSVFDIPKWKPSTPSQNSNVAAIAEGDTYKSYNRVRSSSIDPIAGSYSVSETYLMSKEPYGFDLSCQFQQDETGNVSVTAEGTIFGLSEQNTTSTINDKVIKSRAGLNVISSNGAWTLTSPIGKLVNNVYSNYKINDTELCLMNLDKTPRSITVTENKNLGTIQFNVLYRTISKSSYDLKYSFTGAMSATLNISDDNKKSPGPQMKVIAIIPIVGRIKGPIIQDMSTTKERVRSVSIEVVFREAYRSPNNYNTISGIALGILNSYSPTEAPSAGGCTTTCGGVSATDCFVQDIREEWDWPNGRYTASLQWVYEV